MSAMAPLRVLLVDDEPLARLRLRGLVGDCTEPRAEVVAEAGSWARARSVSQKKSAAASAAPASTAGSSRPLPVRRMSTVPSRTQPKAPPTAPSATAAHHCPASGSRASSRLSRQMDTSHSSTAGSAMVVPWPSRFSQAAQPLAWNETPMAMTPCTKASARSTTPTWQTSKAETGLRTPCGSGTGSKLVEPKMLLPRSSPGRVGSADSGAGRLGVGAKAEVGASASGMGA